LIYLLDINKFIYLMKQRPVKVAMRVDQINSRDRLAMSFITWAELLQGAAGSKKRSLVELQLSELNRQVEVLYPQDSSICSHYAEQAACLRRYRTPMGANDLWIAAHALVLGATLVTHNLREFSRVDGLALEDWVEPQP
jgi:tRNA(fMet)-specific endonuclease VapC